MPTWKRSKKNQGPKKQARRTKVYENLEAELKSGVSRSKVIVTPIEGSHLVKEEYEPLTEDDNKRIKKEMENIKKKL